MAGAVAARRNRAMPEGEHAEEALEPGHTSYRGRVGGEQPSRPRWMARGEHEIPPGEAWLTPSERARAGGMRFTKRRSEYLLRRWVGKQAVAAAAGLPSDPAVLARIEVANRPTGAPSCASTASRRARHLAHRPRRVGGLPGRARARSRVGCDLEIVEPRSAGFVTDFLTAAEQRYVAALPDVDRDVAANLLWSAKESALKVLQTGLRRDTRSVEVPWSTAPGTRTTSGVGPAARDPPRRGRPDHRVVAPRRRLPGDGRRRAAAPAAGAAAGLRRPDDGRAGPLLGGQPLTPP